MQKYIKNLYSLPKPPANQIRKPRKIIKSTKKNKPRANIAASNPTPKSFSPLSQQPNTRKKKKKTRISFNFVFGFGADLGFSFIFMFFMYLEQIKVFGFGAGPCCRRQSSHRLHHLMPVSTSMNQVT